MAERHCQRDDGTILAVSVRDGDDPPLVIVPGVMADAASWQPVADELDVPNTVVVNRRGRAPSGPLGRGTRSAPRSRTCCTSWSASAARGRPSVRLELRRPDRRRGRRLRGEAVASLPLYEPVSRPFAPQVLLVRDAIKAGDLDRAVQIVNGTSPASTPSMSRTYGRARAGGC